MNIKSDINKTGNVRITKHWGASVQPLLQRKLNKNYIKSVCVSAGLGIQYAMRLCHIFIRGMAGSKIFFRITS